MDPTKTKTVWVNGQGFGMRKLSGLTMKRLNYFYVDRKLETDCKWENICALCQSSSKASHYKKDY